MLVARQFGILAVLLTWTGCGQDRDPTLPDLVPVSGAVSLDGNPLANASVYFKPVGTTMGTGSTAITDEAGKYRLSTLHDGVGAPVGEYQVVITKVVMPDGSEFPKDAVLDPMSTPHKNLLSPIYSDPDKSKLTAQVPAGGGTIDFPLKSKP